MNKCLHCGSCVKNKYCNVSCQNKHQNTIKFNKIYGDKRKYELICCECGKAIIKYFREKLFIAKNYKCVSCSHRRVISENQKRMVSKKLSGREQMYEERFCLECGIGFTIKPYFKKKFCSKKCSSKYTSKNIDIDTRRKWGLKSVAIQAEKRRSKNEIYFYELCKSKFSNVSNNEQIFNGWDADVIIHDLKIAVLWNGKWHYEKIKRNHSVSQVENRDKIKIREIENKGFKSYIIKDMGKFDKKFVELEFDKFILWIGAGGRSASHDPHKVI